MEELQSPLDWGGVLAAAEHGVHSMLDAVDPTIRSCLRGGLEVADDGVYGVTGEVEHRQRPAKAAHEEKGEEWSITALLWTLDAWIAA